MGEQFTTRDYVSQKGAKMRDLYHWVGLRVVFLSEGEATKFEFYQLLVQFSSTIGLIMAAKILVEFCMLNCYPERSHFKKLKMIKSRDIND